MKFAKYSDSFQVIEPNSNESTVSKEWETADSSSRSGSCRCPGGIAGSSRSGGNCEITKYISGLLIHNHS